MICGPHFTLFVYVVFLLYVFFVFFFFQAEDGIRDHCVTGVQTLLFRSKPDALKALPELNGKPASARYKPVANPPRPRPAVPCPYPLSSELNAFAQIARQPFPGSRPARVPRRWG